jgi:hypothetical protein
MNTYPSHQLQNENYHEWRAYFARFPWQWKVELTFNKKFTKGSWFCVGDVETLESEKMTYFSGRKLFKRWQLQIVDKEKLQIGAYLIASYKLDYLHFHVLMLGRNRDGKTLLDCATREWCRRWPFHAKISVIDNVWGAADYAAKHFMGFKSDFASAESYGNTLLKQVMQQQRDGLDNYDGLLTN